MEKSPMIKFLEMTKSDDNLVKSYKTIRMWLQKEGHTSDSAQRISGAPTEIWAARHELSGGMEKLKDMLRRYGILHDENELIDYVQNKLKRIDKEYPLSDEL